MIGSIVELAKERGFVSEYDDAAQLPDGADVLEAIDFLAETQPPGFRQSVLKLAIEEALGSVGDVPLSGDMVADYRLLSLRMRGRPVTEVSRDRLERFVAEHKPGGKDHDQLTHGRKKAAAPKQSVTKSSQWITDNTDRLKQTKLRKFGNTTAKQFIDAQKGMARTPFLTQHSEESLKKIVDDGGRLFLSDDGRTGYILNGANDLQNLFNNGGPAGAGIAALVDGIANGAETLDAFDPFLPRLYNTFGFKAYEAWRWNDEYAPDGWDYEKNERPDVILMRYKGGTRDGKEILKQLGTHGGYVSPFDASKSGKLDGTGVDESKRGTRSRGKPLDGEGSRLGNSNGEGCRDHRLKFKWNGERWVAEHGEHDQKSHGRRDGGSSKDRVKQTDTPEFKRWFGHSQIVDESGNPLVVYHEGASGITAFDNANAIAKRVESAGMFFTKDRDIAAGYGDQVYEVYLSVVDPVEIDFIGGSTVYFDGKSRTPSELVKRIAEINDDLDNMYDIGDDLKDELDGLGWSPFVADKIDGVILRNVNDTAGFLESIPPTDHYVAFEPTQIKSATGNRGTFDPNSPNINEQHPRVERALSILESDTTPTLKQVVEQLKEPS